MSVGSSDGSSAARSSVLGGRPRSAVSVLTASTELDSQSTNAAAAAVLDERADTDQYMDALRNFDLNPAVSKKTSQATKVVAGMAVATLGMEEKFNLSRGSLDGMWLLPVANPDYFTPERVKSLLEQGKLVGDVGAYLEKRMSGEEASAFRKNYEVTPEGKPMNDTELGQLYNAMDKARAEWAALDQKIKAND